MKQIPLGLLGAATWARDNVRSIAVHGHVVGEIGSFGECVGRGGVPQELELGAGPGARADVVAGAEGDLPPATAAATATATATVTTAATAPATARVFGFPRGRGGVGWRGSRSRGRDSEREQTWERDRELAQVVGGSSRIRRWRQVEPYTFFAGLPPG